MPPEEGRKAYQNTDTLPTIHMCRSRASGYHGNGHNFVHSSSRVIKGTQGVAAAPSCPKYFFLRRSSPTSGPSPPRPQSETNRKRVNRRLPSRAPLRRSRRRSAQGPESPPAAAAAAVAVRVAQRSVHRRRRRRRRRRRTRSATTDRRHCSRRCSAPAHSTR